MTKFWRRSEYTSRPNFRSFLPDVLLQISGHSFHYIDVIMTMMTSQITSLTVVYSTVYSDADQRKHQSSASLAFVRGIHRDRWIPRTKGQLRGKCFHLMTSSCDAFSRQCPKPPNLTHFTIMAWWCLRPEIRITGYVYKSKEVKSMVKGERKHTSDIESCLVSSWWGMLYWTELSYTEAWISSYIR